MSLTGKMSFMLQILGLDRFTKGKAAKGLAMAGKDQNPFDQGLVRVRSNLPLHSLFPLSSFLSSTRRTELLPFARSFPFRRTVETSGALEEDFKWIIPNSTRFQTLDSTSEG